MSGWSRKVPFANMRILHCVKHFHSLSGRWASSWRQTSVLHVKLGQFPTCPRSSQVFVFCNKDIPSRNNQSSHLPFLRLCISVFLAWRNIAGRVIFMSH